MENSSKPWANLGENHFNIQADHLIASESVDGHFEESDSMPNVLYLFGADYQVGADEDSAFVRCIRAAKKVEKIHPDSIKTIDIKNHDDGVDVKVIFEQELDSELELCANISFDDFDGDIEEALSKVKAVDLWDDIKELISFNHIDTQRCDL